MINKLLNGLMFGETSALNITNIEEPSVLYGILTDKELDVSYLDSKLGSFDVIISSLKDRKVMDMEYMIPTIILYMEFRYHGAMLFRKFVKFEGSYDYDEKLFVPKNYDIVDELYYEDVEDELGSTHDYVAIN